MELTLNDWHPLILSMMGGIIMGAVMFKYLPGMKSNAYTPREWVPVGLLLVVMAWLTFFAPQLLHSANFDVSVTGFAEQWLEVGLAYTVYALSVTSTLLVLQYRRIRRDTRD